MQNERGEIGRWWMSEAGSWSADLPRLNRYVMEGGHQDPGIPVQYGQLSILAHPTPDACTNSVSLLFSGFQQLDAEGNEALRNVIVSFEPEPATLLYRLLWLGLHHDESLIRMPMQDERVPLYLEFVRPRRAIEPN
jgi:hypothetical protein